MGRIGRVITLGQTPFDDERTRDQKAICTCLLLIIILVGGFYFIDSDAAIAQRAIEASLLLSEVWGLFVLWRLKSVKALFVLYVPLYLATIFVLSLKSGLEEGDFVGFIAVPIAAIVLLGVRESFVWSVICVLAVLALPILSSEIPAIYHPSFVSERNPLGVVFNSPTSRPIDTMVSLTIAAITVIVYLLFRAFNVQLLRARQDIEVEKAKVDKLMSAMFPASVLAKLTENETEKIAIQHQSVTIVFADIVGFSELAAGQNAAEVVNYLNRVFTFVDRMSEDHGVEKIKAIGDAYMGACGLNDGEDDHLLRVAHFAMALSDQVAQIERPDGKVTQLRIGLNAGPVTAGVLGGSKPYFDVWGHTVNLAARLESSGAAGRVHVSKQVAQQLGRDFSFDAPRTLNLKGLGEVEAVFLHKA